MNGSIVNWEGHVEAVNGDFFTAVLIDKGNKEPDLRAEVLISRLDESERPLVAEGAIFDWSMGVDGDCFRFRRAKRWTQAKIDKYNADAKKLREDLGWT